jgi:hypothetical protein
VVTIDGTAQSPLLGKISVHGQWRREANELTLSIKALGVPLDDSLVEHRACLCPKNKLADLHLKGQANVHVNAAFRPGNESRRHPLPGYNEWFSQCPERARLASRRTSTTTTG